MSANEKSLYNRILAAVPLHIEGHPAVSRAINIAQRTHGEVTLVHVIEHADEKTDSARRYVERLMSLQPLVRDMRLVSGRTWSAINDVAQAINASLVVIGSHVHGQLRALLGSTSDSILHHADRDILLVRSEIYNDQRPPEDYSRILAAVDVNRPSQRIVDKAAALAKTYGAHLTLLNVVEHYPVNRENEDITPEDHDPVQYQHSVRIEILSKMAEATGYTEVAQEVLLTDGAAGRAVSDYAKEQAVDLIAIGAHGNYGVDALFGATADAIAHRAPCDVLVVASEHPEGFPDGQNGQ
ncbi:MAG: universal stress protein [Gammaproteobacteria bacterium]